MRISPSLTHYSRHFQSEYRLLRSRQVQWLQRWHGRRGIILAPEQDTLYWPYSCKRRHWGDCCSTFPGMGSDRTNTCFDFERRCFRHLFKRGTRAFFATSIMLLRSVLNIFTRRTPNSRKKQWPIRVCITKAYIYVPCMLKPLPNRSG